MFATLIPTASPASGSPKRINRVARTVLTVGLAIVLASCGGGSGSSSETANPGGNMRISAAMLPANSSDAYRFLTQASFGPTPESVARVSQIGYDNWIDEQFALPLQSTHQQMAMASATARGATDANVYDVLVTWWTHAVRDPAQLRQRVAFALSEIFVVSTTSQGNGRTVASYMDMLDSHADGSYRDLLEAVATHPAMGQYLSHMSNRKEDTNTGRVPDENFAREIMQLFSIGLYELDDSGNPKVVNGKQVETYTADDIKGLAKVFTGWSWNWPSAKSAVIWWHCFWRAADCKESSQDVSPMTPYAQEHSTSAKQFLGVTIPAQSSADPRASLRIALDTLANHPNTAPFISRQLIQRLVTSNPSNQYVADITGVFRATQGNLHAVVKAILLHDEARHPSNYDTTTYGKLREPVLKWAHLLRAIPHNSVTYNSALSNGTLPIYQVYETDSASSSLGQSPMRAPSVFNYFRPGYKAPQSLMTTAGLVAPEMQIANETSVIGYVNFVTAALRDGWGQWLPGSTRYDIQFETATWDSVASDASRLIDAVSTRLLGTVLQDDVRDQAITALSAIPAADANGKRVRITGALLLVAASPAFNIQQ
ncbi:MAG TPA: DUF1800 domain-containing protein [Aquabacterium sp.]|uniref:DUF1800 domain-containing protein n=1 Tax=Aquabacterium sp. TaxID=1872578 RepID=UPI002E330857|nr:DUF1800 domain-containing protein [Aquabacterium sp.]HEX5357504.1 DUF1800 domain-containing protein [Aquabacterium sp.]